MCIRIAYSFHYLYTCDGSSFSYSSSVHCNQNPAILPVSKCHLHSLGKDGQAGVWKLKLGGGKNLKRTKSMEMAFLRAKKKKAVYINLGDPNQNLIGVMKNGGVNWCRILVARLTTWVMYRGISLKIWMLQNRQAAQVPAASIPGAAMLMWHAYLKSYPQISMTQEKYPQNRSGLFEKQNNWGIFKENTPAKGPHWSLQGGWQAWRLSWPLIFSEHMALNYPGLWLKMIPWRKMDCFNHTEVKDGERKWCKILKV